MLKENLDFDNFSDITSFDFPHFLELNSALEDYCFVVSANRLLAPQAFKNQI